MTPDRNDGKTVYRLDVKDVPVDGFWSISVYNERGFFEPNPEHAYTVNSVTAKTAPDGSIVVQFGGCDGTTANCLPTPPGWSYLVRLYQPRAAILNGAWTFPEPKPDPKTSRRRASSRPEHATQDPLGRLANWRRRRDSNPR